VSQSIADESRLLRSITSRLVDGLVFPNIEVGVRPDGPIKGHRPDAALIGIGIAADYLDQLASALGCDVCS
jgi:hypothetical protein